ncbi:HAMP domain-containing histidine kinase [Chlorobium sp. KB01]|uniref:HAMP domain-containing histidine kinase n=1 Tax=Chlorobium sp. KB01 TaxID=1917528 RepID=UPI00097868ED|nr:HAMP domain-containing histidine kinase [Chlorobium sp. KB01]
MKIGIRQKLLLGLGGMLVIIAAISFMTIRQIDELGSSLGIVLKQNYLSVVACQDMKDALERIDSGVLNSFIGNHEDGVQMVNEHKAKFNDALSRELHNITLPGEQERADRVRSLSAEYFGTLSIVMDSSKPESLRRTLYYKKLVPMFDELKVVAREIFELNESSMISEKNATRDLSISARWRVLSIGTVSVLVALLLGYQIQRWVLNPLRNLIKTTEEIRRGNLDVVLQTAAEDEVGQLSRSFNAMLVALRQNRNTEMANLVRSRKLTEDIFRVLPFPVALLDPRSIVTIATEKAVNFFSLKPGVSVTALPFSWIPELLETSIANLRPAGLAEDGYVQQFVGNKEYFFQPVAVPIVSESGEVTGSILMISDVTQLHEQQEMKRGVLSTVSHQLKTPLTSLRMSIHLLLQEEVGELNVQQTELMVGAREDCERLVEMLDDLLDLNRIESGKGQLEPRPVQPSVLVREGIESFLAEARDRNVTLTVTTADELSDVVADPSAVRHIFANLLSNALRFTMPGGTVKVGAGMNGNFVRFFVEDTGSGIASEHLTHLFEQFYRAPGQDERSGVGLGLSIVKELVDAQGGKVTSQSQPGKGSCFSFTLPLHKQQLSNVNIFNKKEAV